MKEIERDTLRSWPEVEVSLRGFSRPEGGFAATLKTLLEQPSRMAVQNRNYLALTRA